ncbi:hypothetical protein TcWFU_002075 [Taenia crassiceps]|uniref:Uncharacterized protein n=1 Tax=Taenia crassiceps TaxID=6207 RepID=A0ABR4Q2G9_9CEST
MRARYLARLEEGSDANSTVVIHRSRLRGDFVAVHQLGEIVTSYTKVSGTVRVTRTEFAAAMDKVCTRNLSKCG